MTKVSDLHGKWMKGAEYRKAHQTLKPEFELARPAIRRMTKLGLPVAGVRRMKRESVPNPRKLAP